MATGHPWLFPPAQPLIERLGIEFFRNLLAGPGVYSMRNGTGAVLLEAQQTDSKSTG